MYKKAVFPGTYIQGKGTLNELPNFINSIGKNGFILASRNTKDSIIHKFGESILSANIPVEIFSGECCEEELNRLAFLIKNSNYDIVVGMGGGKCIDTAKIAADRAGIPVIVVPTIASTDAPCSGCAVVYTNDGEFEKVEYQKSNPYLVLVDLNIITNAPVRFLVAGIGDALATWFEARSCERTQSMNECGGLSTLTGLHIAELCYDTILQYGKSACLANSANIITPAFEYIVEANILLSGIGFESSGLAAAHSIHNGLTALEETHHYYHGEKVAFGVIAGLHLTVASPDEIDEVYTFCEMIGLPTTFSDIGLHNPTRNTIMIAAEKACLPGQYIHHEAGIITPEKVCDAMIMADALGRSRKFSLAEI